MYDYRQVQSATSEKMRLIRFRMTREKVRFTDELRLVPRPMVWTVIALYVVALVVGIAVNGMGLIEPPGHDLFQSGLIVSAIVTAGAIPIACIILLIGYVNQDARRRGMNAGLWTLLVTILLPAWVLTGFVIYFLVREPLPYHCTGCGALVSARYNFCPNCKCNLRPTCPECRREIGDQNRYCPYCSYDLAGSESRRASVTAPPDPGR